jgi:hypothetical protein
MAVLVWKSRGLDLARPLPAAAWRLAIGLTVMFVLAPATRFGYFVYPVGLLIWLVVARMGREAPGLRGWTARRGAGAGQPVGAGTGLSGPVNAEESLQMFWFPLMPCRPWLAVATDGPCCLAVPPTRLVNFEPRISAMVPG